MSLTDYIQKTDIEEIERREGDKVVETKKVRVTKRIYQCRPQVAERKRNWVKFGEVRDVPRGTHKKGDFVQN